MDIVSIVASAIALIISIISVCYSAKLTRASTETSVMELMYTSFRNYEMKQRELNDRQLALIFKTIDTDSIDIPFEREISKKDFANVMEYGCVKYLNNELSRKTFKDLWYQVIVSLVDAEIQEGGIICSEGEVYSKLKEVYKRWKD